MTEPIIKHLKAIIFDWAGTTIDHGSCAPAAVFQQVFQTHGVSITAAQAREPMGRAKREHIASIGSMPEVDQKWRAQHSGQTLSEADIDALYADFLPLQLAALYEHSQLIRGASAIMDWCRGQGLKIGSTTGYTRELLDVVMAAAEKQGYVPDCALGAEDAPLGRPAPFLIFEAAKRMQVYPLWNIVKVDDTPVGIQAGRNAGCWTVGITRTGNCVGLAEAEWDALTPEEQAKLLAEASEKLKVAGAHFIVESVADIKPALEYFDAQLALGKRP